MLEKLRNSVNSWTAKILLALLVLSFAVWGISDVFVNRQATVVATVGEKEVTRDEFASALSQDLQTLQRQVGRAVSISEVRQLGRDQLVLAGLTTRKALNAEAESLGLSADPAAIRNAIETSPAFLNSAGAFDRFSYEARLRYQGMTPSEFENDVREDLAREAMLQAVGVGTSAPRALAEVVHIFRNEQRVLDYITLSIDDTEDPGTPTDEQLATFHEENASRFSAPDYRKLSFVWITPESLAETIKISDELVREAYDIRANEFTTPATRTLDQLLFDTEENANAAKARVEGGEPFATIITEQNVSLRDASLGQVGDGELPSDLNDAAFAATEPGVVGPIRTAFGWTLLNISEATQEAVTPLADVQDEIRQDLALNEARDLIIEESVAMDDELAGGSQISEITTRTEARFASVEAVDAAGLGPDGEPVEAMPPIGQFLGAAFAAEIDDTPILVEADGEGYFALRVEGITPSALRPLDTITDEVTEAWKLAEREKTLVVVAQEIEASLQEGKTLSAVAAEREKDVETTDPLRRSDTHPVLTSALIDAVFAADEGGIIEGRTGDGSHIVGTLKEIVKQDAETAQNAVDSTAERYSSQLATDIVQTFSRTATENHPLSVRPAAIDATIADLGQRY